MARPLDQAPDASVADGDDVDALLLRPDSAPALRDRVHAWVEWFGLARLVTSACAVTVVCAGAWFLVRTPPPPTEASLPTASSGSPPPATLPVASGVPARPATTAPSRSTVHVAGAVRLPGVYVLGPGSRVDDAVRAAGGATSDADPGRINLAAPLVDGDQVYVPAVGEEPPPLLGVESVGSDEAQSGPIDVNRASAAELESLPGVGPATAAAIVDDRERNGPFVSLDDLERVPGIGPAKLAALAGLVAT